MAQSISNILLQHHVRYLGAIKSSAKMLASYRHNEITYAIHLAPADSSGYNVCPCSQHCREKCLNLSGHNKVFELSSKRNPIKTARINKTRWFFEDRESFMKVMVAEINRFRRYAERNGYGFSVRINATSDLSPELFTLYGSNILEIFPDIQFYDYTKVPSRLHLANKYANYDLTFSYDGYNWEACQKALDNGIRVAVVFDGDLPETFNGYRVIDGNEYNMRYTDPKECIVGLHYHPVASDYTNGKYHAPDTPFVVKSATDARCNLKPATNLPIAV